MQASKARRDSTPAPLGERRRIVELARFSLDPSGTRAASDFARVRAYPSPPMSDSPLLPPPRNPSVDDRPQSSFRGPSPNVSRGLPTPQAEPRVIHGAVPPVAHYQQVPYALTSYSSYQQYGEAAAEQTQHQYQRQAQPHPQEQPRQTPQSVLQQLGPGPGYSPVHQHPGQPLGTGQRLSRIDAPELTSPKAQRKTKGHVASACVPCKRAHLRCDAQRPCDRCMNTGKEDACVDVQHKKRGRPRLRDERESRYEGMGTAYPPPPEHATRRPMSLYSRNEPAVHDPTPAHGPGTYRVLKSQGGPPATHRHLEFASLTDANVYTGPSSSDPRASADQEVPCAFLTMDLQISRVSRRFCDVVGLQSIMARRLYDIVAPGDRDKLYRLQRNLEEERQNHEPNYLPPIYGKAEEDRVIQTIGMGPYDLAQFRIDHSEVLAFQRADGQQRIIEIQVGLAKRDSTYFVVLVAVQPGPVQGAPHALSSPFAKDSQPDFPASAQVSGQLHGMSGYRSFPPQYAESRVYEQSGPFRPPSSHGTHTGSFSAMPGLSHAQPFPRSPYPMPQLLNEMPERQTLQNFPRHNEFQLPPIRSQTGPAPATPQRPDDRSGRLDIGVLLEKPSEPSDSERRSPR